MTAWTTMKTWVALATLPASEMNTYLRDNGTHLKEKVDLAPQRLQVDTTSAANSGAGDTVMCTYSLPANTLSTNGDTVTIRAFGTYAANINAKQVWIAFGGTNVAISTSSAAFTNMSWEMVAIITRTSGTTQKAIGSFQAPTGSAAGFNGTYTTPGETLSGAVTININGNGDASNDILFEGLIIEYAPAA